MRLFLPPALSCRGQGDAEIRASLATDGMERAESLVLEA